MKIVYTKDKSFINFEELLDYVFFSDEEGYLYLKIPAVINGERNQIVNAIDIEDDCYTFFSSGQRVRIMDYELIIKN